MASAAPPRPSYEAIVAADAAFSIAIARGSRAVPDTTPLPDGRLPLGELAPYTVRMWCKWRPRPGAATSCLMFNVYDAVGGASARGLAHIKFEWRAHARGGGGVRVILAYPPADPRRSSEYCEPPQIREAASWEPTDLWAIDVTLARQGYMVFAGGPRGAPPSWLGSLPHDYPLPAAAPLPAALIAPLTAGLAREVPDFDGPVFVERLGASDPPPAWRPPRLDAAAADGARHLRAVPCGSGDGCTPLLLWAAYAGTGLVDVQPLPGGGGGGFTLSFVSAAATIAAQRAANPEVQGFVLHVLRGSSVAAAARGAW